MLTSMLKVTRELTALVRLDYVVAQEIIFSCFYPTLPSLNPNRKAEFSQSQITNWQPANLLRDTEASQSGVEFSKTGSLHYPVQEH